MKLMDMTVSGYLEALQSEAPAPGGGSASALAGAQGMALLMMVCRLTITREKYKEHHEFCLEAEKKGREISEELQELVDRDTQAYLMVTEAFKLPKDTEEARMNRSQAIVAATRVATQVPYRMMEITLSGLQLAGALLGRTNPNAASDLGVAAVNLASGLKGAYYNVLINLSGLKDPEEIEHFRESGMKMVEQGTLLLTRIDKVTEENL